MKEPLVERNPSAVESNKGNKYQRNGLLLGWTRASVVQRTEPLAGGKKMGNHQHDSHCTAPSLARNDSVEPFDETPYGCLTHLLKNIALGNVWKWEHFGGK